MGKVNNYTKNIAISETKTFAILLVIFYHCMLFYKNPSPFWPLNAGIASPGVITLTTFLGDCLVPSLVLCSGFLFLLSTRNHPRSRWEMLKNKVKRLIWPYFIYGALWLVPLYTFFDIPTFGRPLHTDFVSGFIAMCIGVFKDSFMVFIAIVLGNIIFHNYKKSFGWKKIDCGWCFNSYYCSMC